MLKNLKLATHGKINNDNYQIAPAIAQSYCNQTPESG